MQVTLHVILSINCNKRPKGNDYAYSRPESEIQNLGD